MSNISNGNPSTLVMFGVIGTLFLTIVTLLWHALLLPNLQSHDDAILGAQVLIGLHVLMLGVLLFSGLSRAPSLPSGGASGIEESR